MSALEEPRNGIVIFPVQTHHWTWNPLTLGRIAWRATVATIASLRGAGPDYISIDEFLTTARTGDAVLFESDGLYSWLQTFWTGSTASHVAVVVVDANGEVYFLESTYAEKGVVNVITNETKSGPMLVRAADRIHHYLNHVGFVVRLRRMWIADEALDDTHKKTDANSRCRGDWAEVAFELARQKQAVPFNANVEDLMAGSIPTMRLFLRSTGLEALVPKGPGGEFCAELAAEFYMAVGAMMHARPQNQFAPKDFTEAAYNLPMASGFGFYRPQWIFY